MDVHGIGQALHELQFEQKTLAPIIWILVNALGATKPNPMEINHHGETNKKIKTLEIRRGITRLRGARVGVMITIVAGGIHMRSVREL